MTRPGGADVSENVLADLVTALDLVVLERLPGGALFHLGDQPPPAWFVDTFHKVDRDQPVTLPAGVPRPRCVSVGSGGFWERRADGHLESERSWCPRPAAQNLPLAAVAVVLKGRRFLLLQRVAGFDDRQHILQRARERALEHEDVVKRIDSLRRPAATLARLAAELQDMELGEQPRKHLDSLTTAVETLRKQLEELPQMPRGTTARRP